MGAGFPFFFTVFVPYVYRIDVKWPSMLGLMVGWIGVGLGFAISGIRRGSELGRTFGIITILLSAFAVFALLSPFLFQVRY